MTGAMPRLTLCAIALNEQEMLPGMLESVFGLVDEMVVGVDSRTTDLMATWTPEDYQLAAGCPATVFTFDWRDDFAYARNLTIEAATGKWILVLDADEVLLPDGAAAIGEVIDNASEEPAPDAVTGICFWISQRDLQDNQRVLQRSSSRLFRRRPEIRYRGIVHEEISWLPDPANTTALEIKGGPHFVHYGYDPIVWERRGKYARNLRLLEQRVAADPTDEHARTKLRDLLAVAR